MLVADCSVGEVEEGAGFADKVDEAVVSAGNTEEAVGLAGKAEEAVGCLGRAQERGRMGRRRQRGREGERDGAEEAAAKRQVDAAVWDGEGMEEVEAGAH